MRHNQIVASVTVEGKLQHVSHGVAGWTTVLKPFAVIRQLKRKSLKSSKKHAPMSFTNSKDRIFKTYDRFAVWLAHRSAPVRHVVYGLIRGFFWLAYLFPGASVRPTAKALSRYLGNISARRLFSRYVTGFLRGLDRTERVRHGFGAEMDQMLVVPDQERLDRILAETGAIIVMPHVHGAFAMARGLSQNHDVMCLVRLTNNALRAEAQKQLYSNVGCEFHDVRHGNSGTVARSLLRSLKAKKVVIGLVDRIEFPAPPLDEATEMTHATAFGETVSITTWPARFAHKAGVPILPAMVVQTRTENRLILSDTIHPTPDLEGATQDWVSALEELMRQHPDEWAFWLDKNWSRVLRKDSAP